MNSSETQYDVVIVGGAAAGLTAALYSARRTLSTLVISKDIGGQASITSEIENYPGRGLVDGFELMDDFRKQSEKFGARIVIDEVTRVTPKSETSFEITTVSGTTYSAKGVILAFGLTPRDLGVPGEAQFKGRGVSTCVTCDGPLYKGKTVAVVGTGLPLVDGAELMIKIAAHVYAVEKKQKFVGEKAMIALVEAAPNVEKLFSSEVTEILGDQKVTGIRVKNSVSGEEKNIAVDGVFTELGYIAKTDCVKGVIELDGENHIVIDEKNATDVPGVFAAGDITSVSYKQVVVSAGEGAKAALSLYTYLQSKGVIARGVNIDWGIVKA
ncbi:MAG: FAD-dependent oxidoreductase [Candidatus Kerfeldbacteria bacterium]|nr:FAD-dependent oxidoreductase [Candidatus Kerfeldbacteria bacterium]